MQTQFWKDDEAQDLVEYVFLLAFIALICILGMQQLGIAINTTYGSVNTSLAAAGS